MTTEERTKLTERELQQCVNNHVYISQSALVQDLLTKNIFEIEDIQNLSIPNPQSLKQRIKEMKETDEIDDVKKDVPDEDYIKYATEECEANGNMIEQEIFEWYAVSDWLAKQLKEHNEPVLENDYGTWWGRTCTGQAIAMDSVIEDIFTA